MKNEALKIFNEKNEYYKNVEEKKQKYEDSIRESKYVNFENIKMTNDSKKDVKNEYVNYIENVKNLLLIESLEYLFALSVNGGTHLQESSKLYAKKIIENYVNENSSFDIISKMSRQNTLFLNSLTESIDNAYVSILEKVDKNNPKTFVVSSDDIETFYDSLDAESFTNASDLIRMRVSSSVEEFVSNNKEDKACIEDLLNGTKDKIDSLDLSKKDSDKIEESYTRECKGKIGDIKSSRQRNVLEELIFKNSNEILKDKALLESFSDDGKINIESIIEHTEIAYTFLEMLNTIKIDECNKESIIDIIKN